MWKFEINWSSGTKENIQRFFAWLRVKQTMENKPIKCSFIVDSKRENDLIFVLIKHNISDRIFLTNSVIS